MKAYSIDLRERVDPSKLVFIDETWAKTNMTRTRGRCKRGDRICREIIGKYYASSYCRHARRALAGQGHAGSRNLCLGKMKYRVVVDTTTQYSTCTDNVHRQGVTYERATAHRRLDDERGCCRRQRGTSHCPMPKENRKRQPSPNALPALRFRRMAGRSATSIIDHDQSQAVRE